jgi:glycerophosphoryl diester phosphodiesterase
VTEIFAHRGLHQIAAENTLAAFLEAKAVGADGVELDVRRSADGALIVHHDADIASLGALSELTLREIPDGVATLSDALTACAGVRVNVEIKNDPSEKGFDPSGALAAQVVGTIIDLGWRDEVVISSFDLATCEAVRAIDAEIQVGWLLDWRRDAAPTVAMVRERGLNAIHPFFQRTDEALVKSAHECGIAVNVWTVNFVDEMVRLLDLDVDTLITDDPAVALSVLASRGPLG